MTTLVTRFAFLISLALISLGNVAQADNFGGRADKYDQSFNKTAKQIGTKHRIELVKCSGTLCTYKGTGNVFVTVMSESKVDKTMTSVSAVLASDTEHLGFVMAVMTTIATFSPDLSANERLGVFNKIVDDSLSSTKYGQRFVGKMKYSMKSLEYVGLWFTAEKVD